MNLEQAKLQTKRLFETGQSVIWKSGSGMGKSSGAVQLFEDIAAAGEKRGEKWGLCIIFGATHTPSDVLGYLYKGEREIVTGYDADGAPIHKTVTVTDPSIPLWMISTEGKPAFCYDRVFLIIDEWGQSDPETKKPLAEVLLKGGTPPWFLPKGSAVLALTNEGSRYGVTKEWDFVIARWTELNISPDIDVTLRHMDKPYGHRGQKWEVMPVTKAWAAANPQIIFEDPPAKQGPWCNPRQLFAADRFLQTYFKDSGKQEADDAVVEVLHGTIGAAATTSYASHLQFRLQLPSYDQVVADPMGTEVPTRADLQMLMAYELSHYAKPDDLGAVIQYLSKKDANGHGMTKDMSVTFVSSLLRRDYRGMINNPALQGWVAKNATLISIIHSLSHT